MRRLTARTPLPRGLRATSAALIALAATAGFVLITSFSTNAATISHTHPQSSQLFADAPATPTHLVFLRGGTADPTPRGPRLSLDATRTATLTLASHLRQQGVRVTGEFAASGVIAAAITPHDVARLAAHPTIADITPNRRLTAPALPRDAARDAARADAPWALDRIDQHDLPLDKTYTATSTGKGVTVYVMDSGIRPTHSEIAGKLGEGFSVIKDKYGTGDCYGHGTFMAGIIAGKTYGVAKDATLIPVRFFDCNAGGTDAGFIEALNWILERGKPGEVMNASWGEKVAGSAIVDKSDKVIEAIIAKGVTVVTGAGNDGIDACTFAPARVPTAITVAAMGEPDLYAKRVSNYGACVDLLAPGAKITSSWWQNDTQTNTSSGTSASAPHVVGVVARYLQTHPGALPSDVTTWLLAQTTDGKIGNLPDKTPNKLLYAAPSL